MYKVGDKVRATHTVWRGERGRPKVGSVGVVTGHVKVVEDYNIVRFEDAHLTAVAGEDGYRYIDEWLELIEDNPTFPIGAKVRIVKVNNVEAKEKHIGKTAVVDGHQRRGKPFVALVRNDDGTRNPWVWFDDELELVVDKPAFAVGESVRVYQHCNYMEREGTIFIGDGDDECIRYHDGLHGNGWDFMVNVRFIENITRLPLAAQFAHAIPTVSIEAAPVASTTTPQEEGVVRSVGATVAGLSFSHSQGEVTVFDEDGDCVGAMTLAHFNEVHRILNEEAK